MKKRILLIGYNYHPEPTGVGNYTGEMIEWFNAKGYDCTVLNSYPYYPYWKVQEPYCKKRFLYSMEERTDSKSNGKLKIITSKALVKILFKIEKYMFDQSRRVRSILKRFSEKNSVDIKKLFGHKHNDEIRKIQSVLAVQE
jgi:hypothetical protein